MSDRVTNVQIEDVLSSIRRLVSEDARPRRPVSAPAPAPALAPLAERLVLSPALRVPEPEPPQAADPAEPPMILTAPTLLPGQEEPPVAQLEPAVVQEEQAFAQEDAAVALPAAFLLHDAARAEPEEILSDPDQDADLSLDDDQPEGDDLSGPEDLEPEQQDEAAAEQLEALCAELTEAAEASEDDDLDHVVDAPRLESVFDGWAEEGEPETMVEPSEPDHDSALERKIATLEQMLHRQSHRWTPVPDAQEDEQAEDVPEAEDAGDSRAADLSTLQPEPKDAPDDDAELEHLPAAELPEIDVSAVAEAARTTFPPEVADTVSEGPDDAAADDLAEPDTPSEKPAFVRHMGRTGHSTLEWEDHAPAAADPRPAVLDRDDLPPAAASGATELSEEALHAMVAEIIREELQGVLGERITRNVRKLVRREIHRVLMSQDFD